MSKESSDSEHAMGGSTVFRDVGPGINAKLGGNSKAINSRQVIADAHAHLPTPRVLK
jgi:hypothetical protein